MMNGPKTWACCAMVAIVFLVAGTRLAAEEMFLVRNGETLEKNMRQAEMDAQANPFWLGWTQRKGQTVEGRFVLERRDKNLKDFPARKSALGDCQFEVVFSCDPAEYGERGGGRGPRILLADRGQFGFGAKGSTLTVKVPPDAEHGQHADRQRVQRFLATGGFCRSLSRQSGRRQVASAVGQTCGGDAHILPRWPADDDTTD